jgi:2-methylcitrate dehydratase
MDRIIESMYDFNENIVNTVLDFKTIDEIKKRIADSIFVAYGAMNAEPVRISKISLLPSCGNLNSTIYFTMDKASSDIASYLNGCMTRYIDYNDTYLSKEALHPSDNIPPILAVGEAEGSNGSDIIKGIAMAYQVVGAFSDASSIRDRGWDHVTYISISSAAGIGSMMNLDIERFSHLISLAINNNISLRQTRVGELSMWKGCTVANAGRNSIFAYLIAKNGFTGPQPIFTGERGFFRQVSGDLTLNFEKNRIIRTMIKHFPVEYHAMSAVEVALKLKNEIEGEIESIEVETFQVAYDIIVKDPEKWAPKTKETADHSMPYIIAYTLTYGAPRPESYYEPFISDNNILSLMKKMKFKVTDEFNRMYPEFLPCKIKIKTNKGEWVEEVDVPLGHFRNPYSWENLKEKGFRISKNDDFVNSVISIVRDFEAHDAHELLEVIGNASAGK